MIEMIDLEVIDLFGKLVCCIKVFSWGSLPFLLKTFQIMTYQGNGNLKFVEKVANQILMTCIIAYFVFLF